MRTFQSTEILEPLADRDYPVEYLLSRLRGRRSKLIKDWRTFLYEPAPLEALATARPRGGAPVTTPGIWRNLLREYRWVHGQMNRELREVFGPFFIYTELRTLFICLRHIRARKAEAAADLLAASLLSERIKDMLLTKETIADAVGGMERIFTSLSGSFGGLAQVLDREGLRGVEQRLTNRYLIHVMAMQPHAVIRTFFSRIIDARNILSLYKALRLNAPAKPAYISGGSITGERFDDIMEGGDLFEMNSLIREATGVRIDTPDITRVEAALYRAITRDLRKEGRDPLSVGLILDYLWRCSIEAMNLSILVHARELEREAVGAELVY